MFITVPERTSSAVSNIEVDALSGEAIVTFKNGLAYLYENVSKRSIINLLFNPDVSLGFWVNNNCVQSNRTKYLSYDGLAKKANAYREELLSNIDPKEAKLPQFV
tara:strand:+ start:123 stop:437 length:315 start_codon:yes stop_codon:yes gene_type:complete